MRAQNGGGGGRYKSHLYVTSALDGSGWLAPRLARFTTRNYTALIVSEAECALGLLWTGAENVAPLPGFDLRTAQFATSRCSTTLTRPAQSCNYDQDLPPQYTDYAVKLFTLRGHRHFHTTGDIELMSLKKINNGMESESDVSRTQRHLHSHVKMAYYYVQIKPAALGGKKGALMRSCSDVLSLYVCL